MTCQRFGFWPVICLLILGLQPFPIWGQTNPVVSAKAALACGDWAALYRQIPVLQRERAEVSTATNLVACFRYMAGNFGIMVNVVKSDGSAVVGDPAIEIQGPLSQPFLTQMLAEFPKSMTIRFLLASTYMETGQLKLAIPLLEQSIAINDRSPELLTLLGIARRQTDQVEEAIRLYKRAIELNPKHGPAYASFGAALLFLKKPKEAEQVLREGVAQCPKAATVWSNLGLACRRQNRLDEAIRCYHKSIELKPNSPSDYLNLGAAHAANGDRNAAQAAWQKAVQLDPKGSIGASARRNLNRIGN